MPTAPTVSVIMPVYNAQQHLRAALQSILTQTYGDFELLCIDDGSTDQSLDLIAAAQRDDSRIRLIRQDHQGIVVALNNGLAQAQGQFIARMDGDDVSLPQRFSEQVQFLAAHPKVAVVGTSFRLIDESGRLGDVVAARPSHSQIMTGLRHGNQLAHPTVMGRRQAILNVGGYRPALRLSEDYDLWSRVGQSCELANLTQVLLHYRVHRGQSTAQQRQQQALAVLATQRAMDLRSHGRPDGLDGAVQLTPAVVASLGIDEAAVATAQQQSLLARAGLLTGAGYLDDAIALLEEPSATAAGQAAAHGRLRGKQILLLSWLHMRRRNIPAALRIGLGGWLCHPVAMAAASWQGVQHLWRQWLVRS